MNVGIVGGGVNGLAIAWQLLKDGHNVTLFEKNKLMSATSSNSSKLLHGGLRYLENFEFGLVFEALKERDAWLKMKTDLVHPIRLTYPIYENARRKKWWVGLGVWLYKLMAARSPIPSPRWVDKRKIVKLCPALKKSQLIGGYQFYDAQMDDYALGSWIVEQSINLGLIVLEDTEINQIRTTGELIDISGNVYKFDRIINAAGPWSENLLQSSKISSPFKLDLVRGSHLIVNRYCDQAYMLEVPNEKRIFFVLPWKNKMLIGTTEIRQRLNEKVECSREEMMYLINSYNYWMQDPISEDDVEESFAGLRPLILSSNSPSLATREYAIFKNKALINIYGGKWTTCRALAKKVARKIN